MKQFISKVVGVFCAGLLVAGLWISFSAFAKSDSEKEQVGVDIDTQLESEEAGLVDKEDIFWDNLEELEDDFSDIQQRINQALGQTKGVSSFQEPVQEIRALLDRANDNLEKEDWNQAKKDMDNTTSKLKSLKNSIDLSLGSGDLNADEEETISESEVAPQESVQGQEPVQQSDMPEKKKSGFDGMVS